MKTKKELLADAHETLTLMVDDKISLDSLELESWTQTWPDDAFGFDGVATGSMNTDARTTVVQSSDTEAVLVFHNDTLAYIVYEPTKIFEAALERQELEGVRHLWETGYDERRTYITGQISDLMEEAKAIEIDDETRFGD